jgi:alkylation response protein AidB-like acyl-CoA dehydrogenase
LLGKCDNSYLIIENIEQQGIAAVAAESVGAMQCVLDMTVEYLKTRTQFGRPIGDFQVLQHRAADMYVAVEEARSIAIYAAMMVMEVDIEKRRHAMSTTKAQIGLSCREVGQGGVQLHGGIGITEEYAIGHYFKRLSMIERQFGDFEHHMTILSMMDTPE